MTARSAPAPGNPVDSNGQSATAPTMTHESNAPEARTVLLCDDQQPLRDAIAKVLSGDQRFVVVGEAIDGPSCLARVEQLRPNILILDYSMPGGGPDIARAARHMNPAMHILVFSGRNDPRVKREMLSAGANQYIVKTGRLRPLLDALHQVCAGV